MRPLPIISALCLALLLAACAPAPPSAAPPAPPAAEPAPAPVQPEPPQPSAEPPKPPEEPPQPPAEPVALPALPLWGPPDLHLAVEGGEGGLAFAYAPVSLLGKVLQPVQLEQGTLFVSLQGDAVYLHGLLSSRGGYSGLKEPVLLHRLPLKEGDTWSIAFPGPTGYRYTYRVAGTEAVATPGGEQVAVRLEVLREEEVEQTEWWVPGYGLVRRTRQTAEWKPTRELRRVPARVGVVGRPARDLEALLWDDGESWWVTTLDGRRELFRVQDNYWRSWYAWASAGEQDLLAHTSFPGSWGVFSYSALRYVSETGRLEPVTWISSQGEEESVAGRGGWGKDGVFALRDFTGYPTRLFTYRFDGTAMRADPAGEKLVRAESAAKLAERLIWPPPLGEGDFVALFRDPEAGRKAWAQLQAIEYFPFGVGKVEPVTDEPDTFRLTDGELRVKVRFEAGEADYQITLFEFLPKP